MAQTLRYFLEYPEVVIVRKLPFSVLLPLLELAIWVVLVAIPATLAYTGLDQAARLTVKRPRDSIAGILPNIGDSERWFPLAIALQDRAHFIAAVNMPAMATEILVDLPTTWPESWHPQQLMLDTWRSLIFPFYCLPAWWFVGRGMDALLGTRRQHWATALFGFAIFLLFAVIFCGLAFGLSAADHEDSGWIFWGLGGWCLLFAVTPCAWFRQWRSRRSVTL